MADVQDIMSSLPDDKIDMIAATSVLQQQAGDIRQNKPNWSSYMQSQMISQEDYSCVSSLDKDKKYLQENPAQCAKTLLNMLSHVSKDQTIQYILVLIDDLLQEDRSRVQIFHDYANKKKESVWAPFLNLLNRQDGFIVNMASRVVGKLACWGQEQMPKSDLHFYLQWLKDQLTVAAQKLLHEMEEAEKKRLAEVAAAHHSHHHGGHGHHLHHGGDAQQHAQSSHHHQIAERYREISSAIDDPQRGSSQEVLHVTLTNNEYIQSVGRCLQMMLRVDEYRFAFVTVDGISTLISILSSRVNFQVQYQLVFCLWVLTFNPLLAEKMNKFNVIPILADILSDCAKEKVTRIILAVFRNLIEKPEDSQVAKEHCIAMVQCKVMKQLTILEQRRFDDEDITGDVEFLTEKLQNSVQDLSSFDEYATEVKSARLEWSPVHKSAKFWRENAQRLNEKNYELLRILVHLLETSKDPLVLSVASYDIGEYVRHYPRGKHVIEQLGGKQLVMQLLAHEDPNVRYEALLAVQKLMVHNWEYLGKQLEKESEKTPASGAPISGKA
ncbi:ATPase SFD subunit [Anopheles darlingi]|uniref:ATPase SFD subunit n=1 Tax=Anopheles darlingi TaxID=43151 RepID=W5J9J5_ANODA|nr:V-type proton ATPase subunit H-like isoform X1 [Anopheles albimanus]XP_049536018.1 V-type proton ATPase subunit H isoform X1 [Anopheles darlingi]ETN60671.1 ATPase SFD subunit [Anopheles darlingi]